MPRTAHPWFRCYVEMIGDRKIRRLDFKQRWIWTAIMAAGTDSPVRGKLFVAEDVPMTTAELAEFAGVKERDVTETLALTTRLKMTVIEAGGLIVVTNYDKRQYESDNVTARTRKHRERSKGVPSDDVGTFQHGSYERSGNGRRNGTETETETEQKTSSSDARKRATRLPDDWKPDPDLVAAMRAEGVPDDLARRELPKFRDHWAAASGQNATKRDWRAAWRNWLRRAVEMQPKPRTPLRAVGADFGPEILTWEPPGGES